MDLICASICYRGYAEDEFACTLEKAPQVGFKLMEIHGPMTWTPEAVAVLDPVAIDRKLRSAGLRCAGLYTPPWGGSDAQDVDVRARAIARCVQVAETLGADHVTSTGAQPRTVRGALDRVIACVGRVLEMVDAATPVKLALEPHFKNVLLMPEDFDAVFAAHDDPRLGLCVDTGHFHSAGVDTIGFIRQHASRICSVHLKDHLGTVSMGIGRGETDLMPIVNALRDVGYAGGLTIELEVEDPENLDRYTQEAYGYLSGMLGQKL